MYGYKYQFEGNKQAKLYCIMRMQQIILFRKHKDKQKQYPRLTFTTWLDTDIRQFLKGHRNYWRKHENQFKKRVLVFDVLFFILSLIFTVLIFHFSFLGGLFFSFLVYIGIWLFTKYYQYPRIIGRYMDSLARALDPMCFALDASVRNDLSNYSQTSKIETDSDAK